MTESIYHKETPQGQPSVDTNPSIHLILGKDNALYMQEEHNTLPPQSIAQNARSIFSQLATFYGAVGPGVFSVNEVAERSRREQTAVREFRAQVGRTLPNEVSRATRDDAGVQLKFGNLILSSQIAPGPVTRITEELPPLPEHPERRGSQDSRSILGKLFKILRGVLMRP